MTPENAVRVLNDHDGRLEALEVLESAQEVHRRSRLREKTAAYAAAALFLGGSGVPPAIGLELHVSSQKEADLAAFGCLGGIFAGVFALGYRLSSDEKAKKAAKMGLEASQMLDQYPERWIRQELKLDLVGPNLE